MAQSLMSSPAYKKLGCAIFVLGCTMFEVNVSAQTLSDPTRPPSMLMEPSTTNEVIAGPVLQSILIAPGRHVAIISGQTVTLNGKYGDQTVIKMSETEVVLRNGKELQTLKLFPDFEKKLIRASSK
jgi:MSHA biogenesis protein MshK